MGLVGCHSLLDVTDPTQITASDIATVTGANGQRLLVSQSFGGDLAGVFREVAAFTDEWSYDFPPTANIANDRLIQLDKRRGDVIQAGNGSDNHLGLLTNIYSQAGIVIPAVTAYSPDSVRGEYLAQLYAMRGYAVLQMAEDLCPGFPVTDIINNITVYGGPLSTDSALGLASAQLDSALKYVRDSTRFVALARVTKGRVLLDRGKYDEAAAVVASVPTDVVYRSEQDIRIIMSTFYCATCTILSLGDHEGANGLPFVSAHDPRIPLRRLGPRRVNPSDTLYATTLGSSPSDRITLASGVEARLIQAEVALHDNSANWKPILDSLRTGIGLDTLVDPGTADSRLDLLYRERAFWLFLTGHRLGDLRRLIRNYGRGAETVFPTGAYPGGDGSRYGTSTSIPFILAEQLRYNPYITSGCQDGP